LPETCVVAVSKQRPIVELAGWLTT
jgi:hypothetical protein